MTQAKTRSLMALWERLDQFMIQWMSAYGTLLLRTALAVVFIWFGALKIFGVSPVKELVGHTVYWVSPERFVPFLGLWEALVGLGLLLGIALRLTLFLLFAQMAGTFLVLLVRPEIAFLGGNPLLLSVEGEFVVKNLVLIAAGVVIGGSVRREARQGKR